MPSGGAAAAAAPAAAAAGAGDAKGMKQLDKEFIINLDILFC